MKKLSLLIIISFLILNLQGFAQVTKVYGTYNNHKLKMSYINGKDQDNIVSLEYDLVTKLNNDIAKLKRDNENIDRELNDLKKNYNKLLKNKTTGSDNQTYRDSLEKKIRNLETDIESRNLTINSLNDSILIIQQNIDKFKNSLTAKSKTIDSLKNTILNRPNIDNSIRHDGNNLGIFYHIGVPTLYNNLLKQRGTDNRRIWNRGFTLSHEVNLCFESKSLSPHFPISLGIGIGYNQYNYKATIGYYNDTISNCIDNDNDNYTAFYSFKNIEEKISLSYLSIPLSVSFGQPWDNKISGYGKIVITPAFCISQDLTSSGKYSLTGYYSDWDLALEDFSPLGFGQNNAIDPENLSYQINRFCLFGRISGGIYIPLCATKYGRTSPLIFKIGLNLDFSIIPIAKEQSDNVLSESVYKINQSNLLSGSQYINPNIEFGLIYLLKNNHSKKQ